MADLTGKDVGRYHVVESLGQGGMAEVYKAYDTRLERDVALKVIRKDVIGIAFHDTMMKRFEREAKALARLSHPNIVQVYDFGTYDDAPYLVMEYLSGGALSLKGYGILPYKDAARLLLPIARALDCAHQEGILHRDVKPANILLSRGGEPKLSDFGIAKMLDVEGTTQLTGTNIGIGTPEYMAPEQWLGKPVPQTDVYALGVVFYELVTGKRPYTADTPAAVMLKQASEALPRPREFNADLPEVVEQVLFKALMKDPRDRYSSMAEFAAVLEQLAFGQVAVPSVQPVPPEIMDQTQVAVGREKKAGPTPPPEPLIIATQVSSQPVEIPDTQVMTQPEPLFESKNKSRKKSLGWVVGGIIILGLAAVVISQVWTNLFGAAVKQHGTTTAEVKAGVTPIKTEVGNKDNMVMVWVPGGQFSMGSDTGNNEEKPWHTVILKDFWMDRTEVTNGMYAKCVLDGHCTPPGSKSSDTRASYFGDSLYQNYPVVFISWDQAQAYCTWAGRSLPTEAQWEKAARGTDSRTYPWGEGISCERANYLGCKIGDTIAVGSKPKGASPYGALDMAGNVSEWVADWFDSNYYTNSPSIDPQGPPSPGTYSVQRGGSWGDSVIGLETFYRSWDNPSFRNGNVGFRCAITP